MLNKSEVLEELEKDWQRAVTELQYNDSSTENYDEEENQNDFYEVDLSDAEERREKKNMMTLRKKNKNKKTKRIAKSIRKWINSSSYLI